MSGWQEAKAIIVHKLGSVRFVLLLCMTAVLLFVTINIAYALKKIQALSVQPLQIVHEKKSNGYVRCRLLLIGDSRASQWPLRPSSGWEYEKFAIPGGTSKNIAAMALHLIEQRRSDVILIQSGVNDAIAASFLFGRRRERALAHAARAIGEMARAGRNVGSEVIVLNVVPPVRPEPWKAVIATPRTRLAIAELNLRIYANAKRLHYRVIDVNKILLNSLNEGAVFRRDSLHWTAAAYAELDLRISPFIRC